MLKLQEEQIYFEINTLNFPVNKLLSIFIYVSITIVNTL